MLSDLMIISCKRKQYLIYLRFVPALLLHAFNFFSIFIGTTLLQKWHSLIFSTANRMQHCGTVKVQKTRIDVCQIFWSQQNYISLGKEYNYFRKTNSLNMNKLIVMVCGKFGPRMQTGRIKNIVAARKNLPHSSMKAQVQRQEMDRISIRSCVMLN